MSPATAFKRLNPVERTLLTPELSNPSPRARQGLLGTLQGAGDPVFAAVVEEARALLRELWRTANRDTLILPGGEEAGLETVVLNLVEPGDPVLVVVTGDAGRRIAAAAERAGADVRPVEAPWGAVVDPGALRAALERERPRVVAVAHGDASTGVLQPLGELAALAHEHGALVAADLCSTTGVVDVAVDDLGLDACWAGSQKGLSAYPGLVLLSFGERALARHRERTAPVASWERDLAALRGGRRYETYPAPLLYALVEVLQLAAEQRMDYRVRRHENRRDALVAGLDRLGVQVLVDEAARLPSVTVVRVPDGVDERRVRDELREQFRIEIAAGRGPRSEPTWRIGLMSHSAQPLFIAALLGLLEALLAEQGHAVPDPGAAVRAAVRTLER
ncbi:MAG TPA: aminotransferase class V-fold PLP-dependent enzyme [Solirubrobacter sp.]|nr:aminotransferase class V-fold PLP-dependent enzyme [Solirubrobacter sp.]